MNPLMSFVLLCAVIAISVGLARLVVWIFDQRQAAAVRSLTQASIVAHAAKEVRRA
jgi:hypothetical protein